jgi:hypothetical protein
MVIVVVGAIVVSCKCVTWTTASRTGCKNNCVFRYTNGHVLSDTNMTCFC